MSSKTGARSQPLLHDGLVGDDGIEELAAIWPCSALAVGALSSACFLTACWERTRRSGAGSDNDAVELPVHGQRGSAVATCSGRTGLDPASAADPLLADPRYDSLALLTRRLADSLPRCRCSRHSV